MYEASPEILAEIKKIQDDIVELKKLKQKIESKSKTKKTTGKKKTPAKKKTSKRK